jgi:hypothetical protein
MGLRVGLTKGRKELYERKRRGGKGEGKKVRDSGRRSLFFNVNPRHRSRRTGGGGRVKWHGWRGRYPSCTEQLKRLQLTEQLDY